MKQTLTYLIFLAFLSAVSVKAQIEGIRQKKIDSLTARLREDSVHIYRFQKLRPYLNVDNRNSLINKAPVNFKGLQLGIILYEDHTLGLGFYNINQSSKKPIAVIDGTVSAQKVLSMNYTTLFYQYAFIDKKRFELDIPIEIGLGASKISYSDSVTKKVYRESTGAIIPIGIGLQAIYKPIPWVGLSLLVGYRMVAQKDVSQNFNGGYSSIGLNFDIRQIYRDTKYRLFKRRPYRKHVREILQNEA